MAFDDYFTKRFLEEWGHQFLRDYLIKRNKKTLEKLEATMLKQLERFENEAGQDIFVKIRLLPSITYKNINYDQ